MVDRVALGQEAAPAVDTQKPVATLATPAPTGPTSSLQLPAHAREALHGSGPWQAYLGLAQALERHDMATTEALSRSFGGLDAVLSHSTRSWLAT